MPAQHIACGPFQTQSEKDAVEYLRPRLSAEWILLSNVQHSASTNRPPDDLDVVAIGPSGVVPIEVKHWDSAYLKQNRARVEFEVEKQEMKVRRLAGTLRVSSYLPNRFLLTLGEPGESVREGVKGAHFFGLRGWKELLNVEGPRIFEKTQIDRLARELEPRAAVALGKDLRTFGPYTNLELQTPKEERFRRVYRGVHASTRDRVILFRYDVSALDSKSALKFAQRECDIVRKLQKLDCVPKLHDSFQPAGEYPGEIYFWTLIDPAAPSIDSVASKSAPQQWPVVDRIAFAVESAKSLDEVHRSEGDSGINLHRNLSPESIRRRSNNKPLFTDFLFAQISGAETIASVWKPVDQMRPFTAPEILATGLTASSEASDVYSLCASLLVIFERLVDEPEANRAREILLTGLCEKAQRPTLVRLVEALNAMPNVSEPTVDMDSVPARYWDEEMPPRPLNNRRYKVISRLGSGGIGTTFKVVQLARDSDDEVGTFVAKVIENTAAAPVCLKAYDLVRPFTLLD